MCFNQRGKVLAIGDNLRTDIKGTNNLNIDSIFITDGVHRDEFKNQEELLKLFDKYNTKPKYFQSKLNGNMKIYKNLKINKVHMNGVIAIGNFDGIHLGHQKVIRQAKQKAKYNLPFGLITFEPCL